MKTSLYIFKKKNSYFYKLLLLIQMLKYYGIIDAIIKFYNLIKMILNRF